MGVSERRSGLQPLIRSSAELALDEICLPLGYRLDPAPKRSLLANPPTNADLFVEAVNITDELIPMLLDRT